MQNGNKDSTSHTNKKTAHQSKRCSSIKSLSDFSSFNSIAVSFVKDNNYIISLTDSKTNLSYTNDHGCVLLIELVSSFLLTVNNCK